VRGFLVFTNLRGLRFTPRREGLCACAVYFSNCIDSTYEKPLAP